MTNEKKNWMTIGLVFVVLSGLMIFNGCKEKAEPVTSSVPAKAQETISSAAEQTTCPVMGGAINKDIFTEYKGKKVYFCCSSCVDKFKADPEKYLPKLPQFQK